MAENRTQPTAQSVGTFLDTVENQVRRADGHALLELMTEVTGEPAVMWGPSIVGFGSYHYRYASGREGDAPAVGFSPRKANLALYGLTIAPEAATLLAALGKHKTGAACLYITKLADVDLAVLRDLVRVGYEHMTTEQNQP
ncbi:DUF1801 domain-containing protein [Rhodococcus chondri]|uniref:DUF1801 domain-containing protein n=1 Tax=Rhodococcus chondri TaxID=3065941 RepID=A0ABU7JTP1_9NOCA|nr:DUF1801 domain-containing protein [Rhodococcus sp. CC-R104]MEE2033386.1 DUF1801 domain-containing protein [Rhodococcus sp. CC-R104]